MGRGPRPYRLAADARIVSREELARNFGKRRAPVSHLITPGWQNPLRCIGRLVGGTSALLGDPDGARTYYHQALEVGAKARHRPVIALTRLAIAELLLDSFSGEQAEATEHLDVALAEFTEMKMQPSLERALARLESLKN